MPQDPPQERDPNKTPAHGTLTAGQQANEREQRSRREPAIRTMKSDISEFLKTAKPSYVSLLARQAERGEYQPPSEPKLWMWLAGIGAAAALVLAAFWIFLTPKAPVVVPTAIPNPFIFFDAVSDRTISENRRELFSMLTSADQNSSPGEFRRIIIRFSSEKGATPAGLKDILDVGEGALPQAFINSIVGPPQFFRYRSLSGPTTGFLVETKNPARALEALIISEPSLARDLEFLFAGSPPVFTLGTYQDITYRNLNFRYLKLDPNADRGLGYLLFPARRLMVMATSEETLRAVVDRLFEAR